MNELINYLKRYAKESTSYESGDEDVSNLEYTRGYEDGLICLSREALRILNKKDKLSDPE